MAQFINFNNLPLPDGNSHYAALVNGSFASQFYLESFSLNLGSASGTSGSQMGLGYADDANGTNVVLFERFIVQGAAAVSGFVVSKTYRTPIEIPIGKFLVAFATSAQGQNLFSSVQGYTA